MHNTPTPTPARSRRFLLALGVALTSSLLQWTGYSTINAGQLTPSLAATALGANPRMQVLSGFNQLDPRKISFTTTFNF